MLAPDPRGKLKRDAARLASFQLECRAFGTLRGFKYFDLFMRSRDEFLLLIPRNDAQRDLSSLLPPSIRGAHSAPTANAPSIEEIQQQRPPRINPSDEALKEMSDSYTVALFTGYERYKCPYVYVQSSHEGAKFDKPLEFETTTDWRRKDVGLWEMVIEVLSMFLVPVPPNPFQVDLAYIDNLPMEEALLLTGALLNFLQTVWSNAAPSQASLLDAVYEDIKALQTRHLSHMYQYSIERQPPPY